MKICNNQLGRSMIEMLGVLAIIGVLSVGGIAGYSKAMMKFKINKTINQITHMAAAIKTAYMQQPDKVLDLDLDQDYVGKYARIDISTAIAIGAVPQEMVRESENSLQNIFNGEVGMIPAVGYNATLGEGFLIYYSDIPKEACVALVTYDWTGVFQGISVIDRPSSVTLILGEYCDDSEYYHSDDVMGMVSCNGEPVTLSPADAALGCTCDNDLCSIAFITDD